MATIKNLVKNAASILLLAGIPLIVNGGDIEFKEDNGPK